MTDYYPYHRRLSTIERCLFLAFKEEWISQKEELIKNTSKAEQKLSFKKQQYFDKFSLAQANQTYAIGRSSSFDNTKSIFQKMIEIQQEDNDLKDHFIHSIEGFSPNGVKFNGNIFDVMQINDLMSFVDVIKFIHSFYISNPNKMYGVLIKDGDKFFNPLHPMNAQAFSKAYQDNNVQDYEDKRYKVMLYTYKENETRDNKLYSDIYDELFTNHIINVLSMLEIESNYTTKFDSYQTQSEMNNNYRHDVETTNDYSLFKYGHKRVKINNNLQGEDIQIQPVQLVNNGLAYPYYGIVAETINNGSSSIVGYQLSPMMSCNIGRVYLTTSNGATNVHSANVCTGSFPKASEEGKLSLNHANLQSPFFKEICGPGFYSFAKISVKISLSIYAELFNLERINFIAEEKKKPAISFAEFKKTNKNAKMKDYLECLNSI